MSGRGIIEATPVGVAGTWGGQDARGALLGNALPGLMASGDFAVSQRGAGANMSVDVAQGQAIVTPGQATHQNSYFVRRTSGTAWNTSSDGGYTWTTADASNPRIDLVCLEVRDADMDASGVYQANIRIVDGTPSASATHQLEVGQWPTIPAGVVPIAAVRIPAAASSITTANITSLNPICGGRATQIGPNGVSGETTTSAAYARLTTPDVTFIYVPNSNSRLRVFFDAMWKISVASGTQQAALFLNGTQLKSRPSSNGAPTVQAASATLGTFLGPLVSASSGLATNAGSTADISNVATGEIVTSTSVGASVMEIVGLSSGWYAIEAKYQTSANTLTVSNRRMWSEVIG